MTSVMMLFREGKVIICLKRSPKSHVWRLLHDHAHSDNTVSLDQKTQHLDNTVTTLRAVLSTVERELNRTRSTRDRMINAQACTVARLPVEVLVNIFEMVCAPDAGLSQRFIRKDDLYPSQMRDALSMTCSFWNQVVHSAPSLWNQLVIRDRFQYTSGKVLGGMQNGELEGLSPVAHPGLIPVAMERAGSCALDTHVICKVLSKEATEAFWQDILPRVTQAVGRSRTVHINFYFLPKALSIFSASFPLPRLRYLWLEWRAKPLDENFLDLSQATSLTLLSIYSCVCGLRPCLRLRLPEECQIRWLRLGQIPLRDAMEIVTRCIPRLESLSLEHSVDESPINLPEPYFARLRELDLRGSGPAAIVHTIVAPELQSLEIRCYSFDGPVPYPKALPDTRQFPLLRKLLLPCGLAQHVVMPFLKAHPTLETVGLANMALAKRILSKKNTKSRTPFLPRLVSLWINCDRLRGGDAHACGAFRQLAEGMQPGSSSSGPGCSIHLHTASLPRSQLASLAEEFPGRIHPPVCLPQPGEVWPELAGDYQ